jgi:hypothetical protein
LIQYYYQDSETWFWPYGLDLILRRAYPIGDYLGAGGSVFEKPEGGYYHFISVVEDGISRGISDTVVAMRDTLTIVTDHETIDADNVDIATLTMATTESVVDFHIWGSDYQMDFSGEIIPVGNIATLEFKTAVADRYYVQFSERTSLACGYIFIEAVTP